MGFVTMERILETALTCNSLVPLWGKLLLGSGIISYIWLKRVAWRSLDDRGIPVITPRLLSFGTAGHYVSDNGYPEFAKAQLLDQDRKTVGYYRVTSPGVMTVDTGLIAKLFNTHFHLFNSRNPAMGEIGAGPIFGYTMDLLDDMKSWKRQRSTLTAGFSTKQLNEMIPVFDGVLTSFVDALRKLDQEPIDCKVVGSKFAVDAFTSASFSTIVTDQSGSIRDFAKAPLIDAIFNADAQKFFHQFTQSLIDQRTNNSGNAGRKRDFLNIMLESRITPEESKSATRGLTNNDIIAQTFIFFIAGFETTATTLTAAIWLLIQNPAYIEKIREEANKVDITDCQSLSESSIPWTTAVINETLRFVPPVGIHLRIAKELKGEIEIDGITFRSGDTVEVPVDLLHRHPAYWSRPDEFYPERFIEDPDLVKAPHYMPFGGGPRNCIGMRLALIEIRLGLLRIIQHFNVTLAANTTNAEFIRRPSALATWSKPIDVIFEPVMK